MNGELLEARRRAAMAEAAYEKSEDRGGDAYWQERSAREYRTAAVYAAIAQAEALTRLAEVAETLLEELMPTELR